MAYQVKLDVFEGPMDLLLFFIQRDELDIYDIPISRITDSYLGYLDLMRQLNVSIAGEYLRMAATLMRIKARTLLPQLAAGDVDEEFEDPRTELVQMLIEYKRFKEVAAELKDFENEYRQYFPRNPDRSVVDTNVAPEEMLSDVTLFDLFKTFKHLIENIPETPTHNIRKINVNVRKQSEYLMNKFKANNSFRFSEVIQEAKGKITVIVTFIALLDLMKSGKVRVTQTEVFDDFVVEQRMETAQA